VKENIEIWVDWSIAIKLASLKDVLHGAVHANDVTGHHHKIGSKDGLAFAGKLGILADPVKLLATLSNYNLDILLDGWVVALKLLIELENHIHGGMLAHPVPAGSRSLLTDLKAGIILVGQIAWNISWTAWKLKKNIYKSWLFFFVISSSKK
jgi:hypothetical protein